LKHEIKREIVVNVIDYSGAKRSKAAEALGISMVESLKIAQGRMTFSVVPLWNSPSPLLPQYCLTTNEIISGITPAILNIVNRESGDAKRPARYS
jgi:hypothetical protein